ncbi:helicase HerA-like domain-containing protein [Sporocytophaga myxococcoides]|uniref:helicase HerA-like domain-containing protein n=1 Tax=Sporocytophaga myxococcoides TaxID=153721 RepID=UPI0003F7A471|nr:helicase HerA-like domain-containing protein [Sporocytophaga myxococcoides]
MSDRLKQFEAQLLAGYTFKGEQIKLGAALLDGEVVNGTIVSLPLKTMNRHGLIAGATGTGKTKTLQTIAEGLSEHGVPVLMMDIKGDLSGIAAAGETNPKIEERQQKIAIPFTPKKFPVELLSLSGEKGVRLRATVSEFGPVLFSKILDLNDTQSGIVSLIFKYCDDERLPLLDLKDFKSVLQHIGNEGKENIQKKYGAISSASTGTILRKIIELEQQGAEKFFGEKSFEVEDLVRLDKDGKGFVSIIRLTDIQDKPKLFSTFMLSLLAEIYATFPEAGDLEKPKLVLFIDEAHLIFDEASKALLDQIEAIIKLIRSKGVGIFFCTQNPSDIPQAILGQLGMKVQHALRAFTANDRKMIRLTAENYPLTDFYKTEELLTSLGIGEAMITVLSEKGTPTPLAAVLLRSPQSRMNILSPAETDELIKNSQLVEKYNSVIDRKSAYEMLTEKIHSKDNESDQEEEPAEVTKEKSRRKEKSTLEEVMDSKITRDIGRTIFRELTRGLLGVLGVKSSSRRRR